MVKVAITKKGKVFEGKSPEVINQQLTAAMYEATEFLERKVKEKTPVGVYGAAGGLLSTIHGEVTGKGMPTVKGVVGHQSRYGDVIEKGRRPGKKWPPEGTLIRWMMVKLGMSEPEAITKEFYIRRKIGTKGFSGAHMFERALTSNWSRLKTIFNQYGFKITRELNGK